MVSRLTGTSYFVKVKNVGDYPAYNLLIYLDPTIRTVLPNFKLSTGGIGVLEKGQEETIAVLSEEDVKKLQELRELFVINVEYENILGEGGGIAVSFHPQDPSSYSLTRHRRRKPGLLLSSVEELAQLVRLLKWIRQIEKSTKLRRQSV